MKKEPDFLTDWKIIDENNVRLIYSNGKELTVSKKDFDRTFITFVTSPPEVIERDFCNKGVEQKLNIKQLQNEADELMTNAISTGGDKERYFEEIEKIYSKIKALREKHESLQPTVVETPESNKEIKRIAEFLENEAFEMKEYDDTIIRRIVDCIKVMSDKTIVIILKGGFEITEKLT